MPAPELESELYYPVRDLLSAQGWTVRGEVKGCDVVAVRGEEMVVVELKRTLSLDLLAQGVSRQRLTDAVYLAVPEPETGGQRERLALGTPVIRRLELGLMLVDCARKQVRIVFHPLPAQRRRQAKRRNALLTEFAGRSADENLGGSTGRKLMTAYRETAIQIGVALRKHGPLRPRDLRAMGTGKKTLSILSDNVYGWFERVNQGIYRITPAGEAGLQMWAAMAARKEAELAPWSGTKPQV